MQETAIVEEEVVQESLNDNAVEKPEEELAEQTTGEIQSDESGEQSDSDEDEVIVSIGDEKPQQSEEETKAPNWVKELRKTNTELKRKNRELEQKLRGFSEEEKKPVALGKKPTLEDFDYDADKFENALADWYDLKRKADEESEKARKAQEEQQEAWQEKLKEYGTAKEKLKVKDFDFAEEVVQEFLDVTQQGVLLQGADNPALIVYALGKNPKRAKELADIKDPVKFAFAVAKLETQLKVTNRKPAPAPEKVVSGNASVSGTVDSTLERLRAEAERTGNYSKVIEYKRQKRK